MKAISPPRTIALFIERFLGPNWRTTLSGCVCALACAVAAKPEILAFLPDPPRETLVGIFGLIALLSGGTFAAVSKDARVTGNGSAFDPNKVLESGGLTRTIAPAISLGGILALILLPMFLLSGCAGTAADRNFRSKVSAVSVDTEAAYDPGTRAASGAIRTRFEFRDPSLAGLAK